MSHDEWRAFVLEGTRTGKLATVRADGSPHVAPIWFVLDGDDVMFHTGESSVKGTGATTRSSREPVRRRRRPAVRVRASSRARRSSPGISTRCLRWATAIGGRYMGADRAEEFGRRNAVASELLVRVPPDTGDRASRPSPIDGLRPRGADGARARRGARRPRPRRRPDRRGRRADRHAARCSPAGTTSASSRATRPRTPRCSRSRDAVALRCGGWRLDGCVLVVTLEPCRDVRGRSA